ncbi:MAG: glutamate--tRNA ligase [Candidatus Liptonbacteria bacterium]|nr:glutamate--tRNA ligase [Candidatus Liptonbacteria bacterium]
MTAKHIEKVRVRFAPSPTGHWHVGGVRTTLFNWLFARKQGGVFILRIEDTDAERSKKEYEAEILEMLAWLGLDYDEGPGKGNLGPYRQSERTALYEKYLAKLLEEHRAYYCYCSKEELEAERQALLAQGMPAKYGGHCRNLKNPPAGKKPEVIRFKTPEVEIEFKDLIRGKVKFDAALFGDFVIAKDVHSPLYNFAVVVDDHEMQISHVIRGEEHLSNTPKQILMQKAMGLAEPIYGHLPLILDGERKKLSKRYAETSLLEYRERGFLPGAILNFLALLGWHPSHDKEVFTLKELIQEFDLSRVQKAGAVFNEKKLLWLNREHLRKLSEEEIAKFLDPFLKKKNLTPNSEMLRGLIRLERDRIRTFSEFSESAGLFFSLPDYPSSLLNWKDSPKEETKQMISSLKECFAPLTEKKFTREGIMAALRNLIETKGKGNVLWPLRAALSGQMASPDPLDIASILGKTETLRRLEIALKKI